LDGGAARRKAVTYTQTSMPRVGFDPTTPVFERMKTVSMLYILRELKIVK
jgi:hypothetical protein